MLNQVQLIGNLGADPEVRRTNNGEEVANLRVATSERWKDKASGEQKEKTEWHTVVVWGPLAGIAGKYLHKGSKVFLQGKLQTRKWQDKSGQDKYTTEVVLQGFDAKLSMLDPPSGGRSEGTSERQVSSGENRDEARQYRKPSTQDMDDEIPF